MRIILGYIILYIAITFGSIFISNMFNKKIESCIVIDIFIKMILLYIFGLINQLVIGVIFLNVLSMILGMIVIIKNRKKEKLKENVLTNGFLFFTIIYFVFIIFTLNKVSNIWDEYSYWSTVSKKMFYNNKLVNEGLLALYPPIPSIFQYYFNRTIGIYSQGTEIFANIILGFSLLLPLFEKVKTNKIIPNICIGIIIVCIPAIFNSMIFYQTVYVDVILGLLIGYIFYELYNQKDNKFSILSLILAFIILALTKATGFYISLILVGIIIIKDILKIIEKNKIKKVSILQNIKDNKKEIILIFIILFVIVSSYFIWNIYIKDYEQFKDQIDKEYQTVADKQLSIIEGIKTIKTTLFGNNDKVIDHNLSNRLLFYSIMTKDAIKYPVNISLLSFIILYVIGSIILYRFFIKENNKEFKNITIAIVIGLVFYILFLQLAYITKFSITEALIHASFERYINTYLLGIFILFISIVIDKLENTNINIKYISLTAVILLITPLYIITDATLAYGNENSINQYYLSIPIYEAQKLKGKLNSEDRIYLINQSSDEKATSWQLKYFLIPEIDIKITRKFSEDLENKLEGNLLEKWTNILLKDYDYVYVYDTDEYFNNFARDLVENDIIKDKTLYKIEKQNNIKLVEVK